MTGSEAKVTWKLQARKPTRFRARYRAANMPIRQILRMGLFLDIKIPSFCKLGSPIPERRTEEGTSVSYMRQRDAEHTLQGFGPFVRKTTPRFPGTISHVCSYSA